MSALIVVFICVLKINSVVTIIVFLFSMSPNSNIHFISLHGLQHRLVKHKFKQHALHPLLCTCSITVSLIMLSCAYQMTGSDVLLVKDVDVPLMHTVFLLPYCLSSFTRSPPVSG